MPSIHPNYEYDIFISYRQNDNRSDKWVTNFVDALREELEATLKNPVSIYYDENLHDGLLETHQVDASLAKKLKCLIFIPIISQTYCDETSFAWQHEFLPFINMAKEDELGMNITLNNSNVVSRVLPIKIHRLDIDDQNTLEAVLTGPLRSIDFIYNEAGVNRSLKPSDDRSLNLLKTDYHNQVNKVANAIKDIGVSIINPSDGGIKVPVIKSASPPPGKSSKKGFFVVLASIVVAVAMYFGYMQFFNKTAPTDVEDVTIAVLSFDDQSPNGDQEWLGDGMADEILNVLAKVNGLQVTGKTSSFSFKGKDATIKEIGKTLNVSTVLEGSVSKVGNKLRITAQLIDVETDKHLWSKKYDHHWGEIHSIIDEVAQGISKELINELSIKELEDIKINNVVDPEAYEYYLKGIHFALRKFFLSGYKEKYFTQSEEMFLKAISVDTAYVDAYAGLAKLYDIKSIDDIVSEKDIVYEKKRDSVINLGFKINTNSANLLAIKGSIIASKQKPYSFDSAFYYFAKAYRLNQNSEVTYMEITGTLTTYGLYHKVIAISERLLKTDPLNNLARLTEAYNFEHLGEYDKAVESYTKVLAMDNNDFWSIVGLFRIAVFIDHDKNKAKQLLIKMQELNPVHDKNYLQSFQAYLLAIDGNNVKALDLDRSYRTYSLLNMKEEALDLIEMMGVRTNYKDIYSYLNLKNNASTEFIRDEPRFQEILAKAKEVYEVRLTKYGHYFDD